MQINYFLYFLQKNRMLSLLLAFVTSVYFGYVLDINGLQTKLKTTKQKTNAMLLEVVQRQQGQPVLLEKNGPLSELKNMYSSYRNKFATKFEFSDLLNDLSILAKNNHLELTEVKPGEIQNIDNFEVFPISLKMLGKFQDFAALIYDLAHLEYLMVIPSYRIYISEHDLVLEANLFAYKSEKIFPGTAAKSSSLSANGIAKNTIYNPFASLDSKDSLNKADITNWETKDLNIVGMIKEHGENIAILEDPLEFIYHVSVGDKIGLQKLSVLKISDCAVITRDVSQNIYWREKCNKSG